MLSGQACILFSNKTKEGNNLDTKCICSETINIKSHLFMLGTFTESRCTTRVDNPHHSNDDILRDVLDGEYVQNYPIFAVQKDGLIILGCFDGLEIANPLGSKAKIHKIGK